MTTEAPPKVFMSYSYDNDAHAFWVRQLATDLRDRGVDAMLDQGNWVPDRPGTDVSAVLAAAAPPVIFSANSRGKAACKLFVSHFSPAPVVIPAQPAAVYGHSSIRARKTSVLP